MYKDNQEHKHAILLCRISYKQERGNCGVVPHEWDDKRFYEQTIPRKPVQEI